MILEIIGNVLFVVLCLALGFILCRLFTMFSFRNSEIANINTLPLGTKLKVRGQVQDEFEMWAVKFDGEDKTCGFLLNLEGIPHELSAGDVFEIVEGVDGAREIRVCKIDQEAQFIALNL